MSTGYGRELWCGDSLRTGRYSTGVMTVALALYRRLITPRGTLRGLGTIEGTGGDEESAYGLDIAGLVGAIGDESAVGVLPGLVRGELLKDDRVSDVSVEATSATAEDGTVTITLVIDVLLEDGQSNFALTISVSDAGAVLLGVTT